MGALSRRLNTVLLLRFKTVDLSVNHIIKMPHLLIEERNRFVGHLEAGTSNSNAAI